MRPFRVLVSALLLTLAGCASTGGHWVEVGGQRYEVEIADNDASRAQGPDVPRQDGRRPRHAVHPRLRRAAGVLDEEHPHPAGHPVLRYRPQAGDPAARRAAVLGRRCLPIYPSNAPARYVLELNAGQAAKLKLQDGSEIRFDPKIPAAK
jgi:hypothetical protein